MQGEHLPSTFALDVQVAKVDTHPCYGDHAYQSVFLGVQNFGLTFSKSNRWVDKDGVRENLLFIIRITSYVV